MQHMRSFPRRNICLLLCLVSVACSPNLLADEPKVLRLGTGVNFGNMLEAPNEGDWGLKVEPEYFEFVKQAGFDHVRLPVSWTYHAARESPYKIDEAFLLRVEELITSSLKARLKILVNYHHDDALSKDPMTNRERFLAIWRQLAERFRDLPNDQVAFELLNEPQAAFTISPETWNSLLSETLKIVRTSNPQRTIVVGPVQYNSIQALYSLKLPDDRLLVVTVHYYDPFEFTHQGAEWLKPVPPTGVPWNAKDVSPATRWQNWSWDSRVVGSDKGVTVEYQKGWAGVQLHAVEPMPKPQRIELKVDAAVRLKVALVSKGKRSEKSIEATSGKAIAIDASGFSEIEQFEELVLQSDSPDPVGAFHIQELRLIYKDRTVNVLANAGEKIRADLKVAAEWGTRNRRTIYLGEFGTFQAADLESRAHWTRAVRNVASDLDLDWCYWEFAAGFGIYDPVKREFRRPLLDSLQAK